ncbi:MAG TPA: hypothetical protein VJ810_37750 [Blastocatellia bacterium]|nr:hypothetical protein [Blastocatellia bacterium]
MRLAADICQEHGGISLSVGLNVSGCFFDNTPSIAIVAKFPFGNDVTQTGELEALPEMKDRCQDRSSVAEHLIFIGENEEHGV